MQYTTLGETGLIVSRLSLGAMTFSIAGSGAGDRSFGTIYKSDPMSADVMVRQALDAGINFFDTADVYIIPTMRRYGLGLTVWSPLAGGFLSGKYTRETRSNPDNRYSGFDILPFEKEHGFRLVERMRTIAQDHHACVAQVAIAWLLALSAVSSVIVGAAKTSQLKDNPGASDLVLEAREIAELDAATVLPPVYPNWLQNLIPDGPLIKALARR